MDRQHAPELVARVQHDLRARSAADARKLPLDELVAKAEREHDLLHTRGLEQPQMPLEQGKPAECQQAFRQLLVRRLLQTRSASCGQDNGAHSTPGSGDVRQYYKRARPESVFAASLSRR